MAKFKKNSVLRSFELLLLLGVCTYNLLLVLSWGTSLDALGRVCVGWG